MNSGWRFQMCDLGDPVAFNERQNTNFVSDDLALVIKNFMSAGVILSRFVGNEKKSHASSIVIGKTCSEVSV